MAASLLALLALSGASADFAGLQAIAGEWQGTTAHGKALTVSYRPMSAGTVLVETYGMGSGRETLTVFHPDDQRVLATHYCAQGNQPRLQLASATPRHWVFTFVDATNLPDAKASHLVRLELELPDASHLVRTETYRESGRDEVTRLELKLVR